MKKFWIVFAIVAVLVGGGLGLLWRAVTHLDVTPDIAGGILVWRVDANYEELREESFLGQVLHGRGPVLRDLVVALRRAADDPRIDALLLDIQTLPVDWAKVEELRDAVTTFQASGKPVLAHLSYGGTKEFALASSADRIGMAPEGVLMVLGVTAEMVFLKDTLDKIGMQAEFLHVGKYKSAPEQLTRSSASAANREMTESIVTERYDYLSGLMAEGRGVDLEVARGWIDIGMFDAERAWGTGLVDTVLYRETFLDAQFPEAEHTPLEDYILAGGRGRAEHKIALVYAVGTIMPGENRQDRFMGRIAGSETIVERLRAVRDDATVEAVVLRVDSPGGSALASDLIWHEMALLGEIKPIIVSMSGYAASGGYYIACGADSIFASGGTLTGSIGVFAGKMGMDGLYDKIGIQREFVTRGENALLFSDHGPFTPNQRTLFQGQLESFYERFLAKVAEGRGLSRDEVHAVAQGRVWTGEQALQQGLVDRIGGLVDAITAAKHMIGIDPSEKVTVMTFEEELSLLERLILQAIQDTPGLGQAGGAPAALIGSLADTGPAAQRFLPLVDLLAGDGTLAAAALLDGRPVALPTYRVMLH